MSIRHVFLSVTSHIMAARRSAEPELRRRVQLAAFALAMVVALGLGGCRWVCLKRAALERNVAVGRSRRRW